MAYSLPSWSPIHGKASRRCDAIVLSSVLVGMSILSSHALKDEPVIYPEGYAAARRWPCHHLLAHAGLCQHCRSFKVCLSTYCWWGVRNSHQEELLQRNDNQDRYVCSCVWFAAQALLRVSMYVISNPCNSTCNLWDLNMIRLWWWTNSSA